MTLRDLPSVDRLVRSIDTDLPRAVVTDVCRVVLDDARRAISDGEEVDPTGMAQEAIERLERARPTGVINATGVLLHTNLGRAPLHPDAVEAASRAATGYSNLELSLASGERGGRGRYLEALLTSITGAEAAIAVNNNAAALYLCLVALGRDREVPVSRGELIEIGGSYRLPDLMAASGARLVEVGTTNRTRVSDYQRALSPDTALLLKVHPSNYRIGGFAEDTSLAELRTVATEAQIPLVYDIGSGLVDERSPWIKGPTPRWLAGEPGAVQALETGSDLVTFSGDKLFGGPQAGIVLGREDLVERLRRHPVTRALRMDGPTLAALTTTAELYARGRAGELPFWEMATVEYRDLEERCHRVIGQAQIGAEVSQGVSTPGAGSVPGSELASPVIAIEGDVDRRYLELLSGPTPVLSRREAGRLVLDLRAVEPDLDDRLAQTLAAVCGG